MAKTKTRTSKPKKHVIDESGYMSPAAKAILDKALAEKKKKTK